MVTLNLTAANQLQHINPSQYNGLKQEGQHTIQVGNHQYHVAFQDNQFHVTPNVLNQATTHQPFQEHRAQALQDTLNQFPHLLAANIEAANDKSETRLRRFDNFEAMDRIAHEDYAAAFQTLRSAGHMDTIVALKELRDDPPAQATRDAIPNWVKKDDRKDDPAAVVNMHSLGNWANDQKPWVERNRADDRQQHRTELPANQSHNIPHGAVLNAPDEAWTDYLNQGWMQNGVDRGAAFKLESHVPEHIVNQHNQAAHDGNWQQYASQLESAAGSAGPSRFLKPADHDRNVQSDQLTFFAQELVDLARSGYAVHQGADGKQVAMPKEKAALLDSIRQRPQID
ncbi:hypothetical protein [Chitinivorax sp. B]|uniref:hypothetical protein n=1 Tax=Chitinivorax sp. B TaxID=2502235 RepID=UPI0010F6DCF2|nr:hypothetical protein [Chitinivorax sp. B]